MLKGAFIPSMQSRSPSGTKERGASIPKRMRSQHRTRNKSATKKVSFNPIVQYHAVFALSNAEKSGGWYTDVYFTAAREREESIRKWLSLHHHSLVVQNEDDLNAQGILTQSDVWKKIRAIDDSVLDVLGEQDVQEARLNLSRNKKNRKRGKGRDGSLSMFSRNMAKIAKVYRSHSQQALKEAQSRACRHEQHLKEIAHDPSMPSLSFSRGRQSNARNTLPKKMSSSVVGLREQIIRARLASRDSFLLVSACANPAA
ncbi:unnamed protein product [Cylindrotheca closterium]|uniref:Uncharacterized protein n=1 Tax=Cylindrotheca closterium TaxID=2856 RepID=A0AAD2FCZ7_9STRA|nr:unnamed protein product [Cylindrotheca closterium]